jgi:hypothetical protein
MEVVRGDPDGGEVTGVGGGTDLRYQALQGLKFMAGVNFLKPACGDWGASVLTQAQENAGAGNLTFNRSVLALQAQIEQIDPYGSQSSDKPFKGSELTVSDIFKQASSALAFTSPDTGQIYLSDRFFQTSTTAQVQTIMHETFHTFGFDDVQLGTAAGWNDPGGLTGAQQARAARQYLNNEMSKRCN